MADKLQDYLTNLKMHDAKYQTTFVYGTEEVSKTFLADVQNVLKKTDNWYFVDLDINQDNLMLQLVHVLQKILGEKEIDPKKYDFFNYGACLSALLTCLKKQGKSVLVEIDDIKISDDIRAFISEYQILIGDELDISLLMAGMPENIARVQNDHAISFLLRSNRIQL